MVPGFIDPHGSRWHLFMDWLESCVGFASTDVDFPSDFLHVYYVVNSPRAIPLAIPLTTNHRFNSEVELQGQETSHLVEASWGIRIAGWFTMEHPTKMMMI